MGGHAGGTGSIIEKRDGFAHGNNVSAYGEHSAAFGKDNIAYGDGAIVFGEGNISPWGTNNVLCGGQYLNQNVGPLDPLFVLGNGTSSDNTHNAFVILKNGSILIPNYTDEECTQQDTIKPYVKLVCIQGQLKIK